MPKSAPGSVTAEAETPANDARAVTLRDSGAATSVRDKAHTKARGSRMEAIYIYMYVVYKASPNFRGFPWTLRPPGAVSPGTRADDSPLVAVRARIHDKYDIRDGKHELVFHINSLPCKP